MKNTLFRKVVCFVLSVTMLVGMFGVSASAASLKTEPEENPYSASTLEEMTALVGTPTYEEYLAGCKEIETGNVPLDSINIDVLSFHGDAVKVSDSDLCRGAMGSDEENWINFGDNADSSVYLSALEDKSLGAPTWYFNVSENQVGYYFIKIEYFSCITAESSISSIEKGFKLDGSLVFKEIATVDMDKNWTYWSEDSFRTETAPATSEDEEGVHISYHDEVIDGKTYYIKEVVTVKDGTKTVEKYMLSQDINGNTMAPNSHAVPAWSTKYLQDSSGYYNGYFKFYLSEGDHSISLAAEREPVIVKSIELVPAEEDNALPSYESVLEEWKSLGYKPAANGQIVEIQAEFPDMVSDSSVAPTNDNSSPNNSPISPAAQVYNIIGENGYSAVGQWAAYKFTVSESGMYNLGMRFKQNTLQGMFVCRAIKLSGGQYGLADGTPSAPFAEAYNVEFGYSDSWQSTFLGLRDQNPFLFYFEEGVEYTLYLECSLGTLKEYIQRVEASLDVINSCYLKILKLTGSDPDENYDYKFISTMPDVVISLLEQAQELMDVKNGLQALCGTNGSHIATLETVATLLLTMGKDKGDKIAENMSTLKSYLGTLGTWINNSKTSKISVDSIWVVPATGDSIDNAQPDYSKLPEANANFFQAMWFEIQSFFFSFFVEYDQMGLTVVPDADTPQIDVWLATGRDQSQIWRTMIDAHGGFTESTGTAVVLKLVTGGTLLPSILSGKGPDVYMGLGSADVINYAIRDAVVGISGNAPLKDGWTEEDNAVFANTYYTYVDDGKYVNTTEKREGQEATFVSYTVEQLVADGNFADAAMDTVTLLDVSYGIPQTMGFSMMFYRMDVLAELGQEVPESWDHLLSILPVLQSNNMSIGVSYLSALDFMIYQKGGSMWKYTDSSIYDSRYAGAEIDLDSPIALEAFEFTCRLYTDYSFPVSYDAANRFRTGEMPIIIGDYAGIYNQLTVYATELDGLWEFCSLPGSFRTEADGTQTFNYDSLAGISATVILHGCDNLLAAWQFTQWQTGADAQSEYGNRMVALIGPSAKYETANLKAIENLSWTAKEKAAIMNQMDHLSSIVNYPGSYIYSRYMQFAFYDVVNESARPNDAMMSYIDAINSEITRKRAEFKDFDLWYIGKPDDVEEPVPKSNAK